MLEISENILQKLKCSSCEGFLSTSPVMLKTNGENICGNCALPNDYEDQSGTRNEVYEHLASLIQFPCRYKKNGCNEKLAFGNIANHEKDCEHRLYECPLSAFDSCNWEGKPGYIKQHFEEEHKELIVKHPYSFQPTITSSNETCLLLEVLNFLFLVQVKCNVAAAKLWFCVRFIGNPKFASLFTYKLKAGDNSNNITMKNDVQTNDVLLLSRNNVIEIDINSLLRVARDIQKLICSIKISLKNKNCQQCSKDGTDSKIYLFENGYFCLNCNRKKLEVCKFGSKGCIYKDYSVNVPKHELWFSKFTNQCCEYTKECDYKILSQTCLLEHVISQHCENKVIELLQGSTGALGMRVNTKYEGCLSGYDALFVTNYNFITSVEGAVLDFKIISNLPKSETKNYKCELKLFNSAIQFSTEIEFLLDVESMEYDWHLKYSEINNTKNTMLRRVHDDGKVNYTYNYKLNITRVKSSYT